MKKIIETKHFVYCISIEKDNDPSNPRTEWDNMGTICIPHNRYELSDKDTPTDLDELRKEILGIEYVKEKYNDIVESTQRYNNATGASMKAISWAKFLKNYKEYDEISTFEGAIVPIRLYIHSDITISVCEKESADGFAYVPKETILKEYGGKILTKQLKEKVKTMLVGEIKTFDQYLQGDVFGYYIKRLSKTDFPTWEDMEDEQVKDLGETIESCWGFYYEDEEEMFKDMEKELMGIIEADAKNNDNNELSKIQKALYAAEIATLQLSLPIDEKATMQNTDIVKTLYPCVLD